MSKFERNPNNYVCECDDDDCELTFLDKDWEEAYKKCYGNSYWVLHPDCKRLNIYLIVLITDKYVLVDYS